MCCEKTRVLEYSITSMLPWGNLEEKQLQRRLHLFSHTAPLREYLLLGEGVAVFGAPGVAVIRSQDSGLVVPHPEPNLVPFWAYLVPTSTLLDHTTRGARARTIAYG